MLTMRMYPMMMVAVLGCEKVVISCRNPRLLYEWKAYRPAAAASNLGVVPLAAISASNLAWNSMRMASAVSRFQGSV